MRSPFICTRSLACHFWVAIPINAVPNPACCHALVMLQRLVLWLLALALWQRKRNLRHEDMECWLSLHLVPDGFISQTKTKKDRHARPTHILHLATLQPCEHREGSANGWAWTQASRVSAVIKLTMKMVRWRSRRPKGSPPISCVRGASNGWEPFACARK